MGVNSSIDYSDNARYPAARSSAHDEFDYRINTSHIDPRTGSVLPGVNPLARIPRSVRSGQVGQVLYQQSHDLRGDMDHLVGYDVPDSLINPRAFGALRDRQYIAQLGDSDHHHEIPRRPR